MTGQEESKTNDNINEVNDKIDEANNKSKELRKNTDELNKELKQLDKDLRDGTITNAQARVKLQKLASQVSDIIQRQKALEAEVTLLERKLVLLRVEQNLKDAGLIDDNESIIGAGHPFPGPSGSVFQPWIVGSPGGKVDKEGKVDLGGIKLGWEICVPVVCGGFRARGEVGVGGDIYIPIDLKVEYQSGAFARIRF